MLRHTQKRGFTLIELLVVIAIIGILAAIMIPNILGAIAEAKKTADAANLKELVKQFIAAEAQQVNRPRSTGYQFWQAMFVGENVPGGLTPNDAYMNAGDAGLLCCPVDQVADKQTVRSAVEAAKESGNGVSDLDETHCSYAGPAAGVAQRLKRHEGDLIGCTGSRAGTGFFEDGFSYVRGNQEAGYYEYADLAEDPQHGGQWDADQFEPSWGSDLLQYVENLE